MENIQTVGNLIKVWRERRRKSQLELALDVEISTRHLSFVETGRAKPSREMILLLAENLQIPLRERNKILLSGGYAPVFSERSLDDNSLNAVKTAIDLILQGHEPFPALAVDRHWNIIAANKFVPVLLEGVAPKLLENPINILRLSLHPEGLASKIVDFPQRRNYILKRLRKQADDSADDELEKLFDELSGYEFKGKGNEVLSNSHHEIILPFQIESKFGVLSFISTVTVFGTPIDVTVSEIALETFFPADEKTKEIFYELT